MIQEKETLENLIKLSFADLFALLPFAGSQEKGYSRLINEAISIKMQDVLVQIPPY